MNRTVDTKICEVTVYDDQALVKRRGVVQLTGEEQELIIPQLPIALVSESVQVAGFGNSGVQFLAVRTERTKIAEAVHPKVDQIAEEIGQLEDQKREGQDLLTLLNLQRSFVKDLNNHYLDRLARSNNPEPIDLNKMGNLLDFVGERWQDLSRRIAAQDQEQKQLNSQLQGLRSQLQQLSTPETRESFTLIVTLESSAAGEFELEVSYIVTQASWHPLYNLRWQSTTQNLNLSYLAEVTQNTGEDWLGVGLTLSTLQPKLSSRSPQLCPWYIDLQQFSDRRSRGKETDRQIPRTPPITMPFAGITVEPEPGINDQDYELINSEMPQGEIAKSRGIVMLAVSNRCTIPSDGASHKTTIFNHNYPCRAEYITIPQRINLAYLQATVTNPITSVTLLPGQAYIFRDQTFIGTTEIENIAPGQEFKIDLGIDEGLKIERHLVERQVDKKQIGNQWRTVVNYAYKLIIINLREQNAQVKLIEQLPVSCHPQLKVRLIDSQPQLSAGEMGVWEWSVTLPALDSQELLYQFTVDYPSELRVVGLDI